MQITTFTLSYSDARTDKRQAYRTPQKPISYSIGKGDTTIISLSKNYPLINRFS